jgi:hypothetical protein
VEVDNILLMVAADRPVVFIRTIAAARFLSSKQPRCGATIATKTAASNQRAAGCSKNASVEAAMTARRHIPIVAAAAKQPIVAAGARHEAAGADYGAVRIADLAVVYSPVALIATIAAHVNPTRVTMQKSVDAVVAVEDADYLVPAENVVVHVITPENAVDGMDCSPDRSRVSAVAAAVLVAVATTVVTVGAAQTTSPSIRKVAETAIRHLHPKNHLRPIHRLKKIQTATNPLRTLHLKPMVNRPGISVRRCLLQVPLSSKANSNTTIHQTRLEISL